MSENSLNATVILTGAAGYIGSHTWLALLSAGFNVVGVDNFVNSNPRVLDRVSEISGVDLKFVQGDVRESKILDQCFDLCPAGASVSVIHFAALKAVGESTQRPLDYFENNISGLLSVCQAMNRNQARNIVFSSSATVYGKPESLPISESASLCATNPYGQTKLIGEDLLRGLSQCDSSWKVALLRYFNPVGAHPSGLIGEDPKGIPNNLMPYVAQVAVGKREYLNVFGQDYDTPDGTGVRDYIHVCDLAEGHVAALKYLSREDTSITVNLGTGRGYSVLELAKAYGEAAGREIPVRFAPRRPGDIDACYADPTLARSLLNWEAKRDIRDMCEDSWRWQSSNPNGFEG